jgi:hypothetical protein
LDKLSIWFSEPEENFMMQSFVNQSCEAIIPVMVGSGKGGKLELPDPHYQAGAR